MASAASQHLNLEITVISAKHLKNVNWRKGDLKPYATFYLDNSDQRLATHSDDSGCTRPVWNERFTLPITHPQSDSMLTLEILHCNLSETPKPLVGTVKFPLSQLLVSDDSDNSVRTLELIRPSGRPQGKVRLKLAVKEHSLPPLMQDYHTLPMYGHYYNPAPPPPSGHYSGFPPSPYPYSDHYGYYSSYYPPQPHLPSRPLYNGASNYNLPTGPSAPVYLSSPSPPESLQKTSNYCVPSGPSAPLDYSSTNAMISCGSQLTCTVGGLNQGQEEESNYEKEKVTGRESHSYSDYRREY
ncbi:hypothetical protein P3X46_015704 [Hevea brasiliensis]|uniref:C2 domain-containing protein n=1 Tax=Hevea brasiliensis TaxID=3981 RepID=A0ABQ9LWU3_HEVBR|nr:protein SRC2 homolog [Hevea brasiliensis]XP_021647162.2 protein SRC2 homolog [Hevea brasiliensis]XP_021647163.2 protein SRC2 homolog [Hevea brasiliensis]KAJ9172472.1 hypothetical protein P3X46_015704 [Hevea brasiliensis]